VLSSLPDSNQRRLIITEVIALPADVGTPATDFVRPPLVVRIATALAIFIPLAAVVAAPIFAWGWAFHWADLALMLGMYLVTILGITVGYHRLFVHRSFETTLPIKFILAALGSMAVQGPLFQWVCTHRRHHQHSDSPDDPHTPHHHGEGLGGFVRGFWHSHIGWFFAADPPDRARYIKDLSASRTLRWASALFPLWALLGLAIPAVLGGLIAQSWAGAATGLLWGGLVRIFLGHQVTFSVNSACHLWGGRPFHSNDESRNNALFGILALGEGWHNTHHAFPTSVRHGLRWWEFDASYWVIRGMASVGLAWNLKMPQREALEKARRS